MCEGEPDYGVYLTRLDGNLVSPWHDVPTFCTHNSSLLNFVCTMPRGSLGRFEVKMSAAWNPIAAEFEKRKFPGEPLRCRQLPLSLPYNEGVLPQTWSDPYCLAIDSKYPGDDYLLRAIEIGESRLARGEVVPVRPLGMLAVIEAGQMGWRVIVAAEENAVAGAGTLLSPERLREIRAFLRDTASAPCLFAYDGLLLSNEFTMRVVLGARGDWIESSREGWAQYEERQDPSRYKWYRRGSTHDPMER